MGWTVLGGKGEWVPEGSNLRRVTRDCTQKPVGAGVDLLVLKSEIGVGPAEGKGSQQLLILSLIVRWKLSHERNPEL